MQRKISMSFDPQNITIEDLYRFKFVAKPRISPDGQRVAFAVTTIDERKYEYRSSIWMVPTSSGEAKRFTYGPGNTHSPCWSPDGCWLAFVSEREGETADKSEKEQKKLGKDKPQIWLIPTDGGEARQLTFMEHGASNPVWSPDSKRLLFNAPVGPADEETEDGKPLPKARVIDRLWYRLDGVGFIYERRQHLFLVDVAAGEPQPLDDGGWDGSDAARSPGGSRIAFVSSRADDRWRLPSPDVYTLVINDGKAGDLRCLTEGSLSCGSPSWSPDGSTIAFLGSLKLRSGGHVDIYTISAQAEQGKATNLTQEFEGSFQDWTNSDIGDDHLSPAPTWSSDGKIIHALASHRGATRIFTFSINGAGKNPSTLTPGEVHVRDYSVDSPVNKMALLIGSPTRVQEVFVRSTAASGELRRVTGFNEELLSEMALSTPEYMPYMGADGWPMDGWILKPHDFDPSKKYPLIVEIHGGPATQYGYGFFHEMQLLTAAGYAVLYTNPRGSIGYGRDFALAVRGGWGRKESFA